MSLIPKQAVLRSVFIYLISIMLITIIGGLIFWVILHSYARGTSNPDTLLQTFDTLLLIFLGTLLLVHTVVAVWINGSLISPLEQILQAIDQLSNHLKTNKPITLNQELIGQDEQEEWPELIQPIQSIIKQLNTEKQLVDLESERITTLLSAVPNPILAINQDQTLMFSNPPLIKLFNCPNPEPNVSTLTDITTQPDIKLAFEHTLSNNRSVTLHTMLIAAAETNTASHHLSVIVTPLHLSDESQMVIGAVAVFHDVTEMKRAEQMRTEFVANVSHELRTPLTSIQGYLATLKEDIEQELHDHVNHYLSVLTRNASQLEHLVNDLLELARLDAGIELELDQIQLREFTERVIETLRINSDNKQQSIEIQCHTPTLVAEPKRIEQVIINLVGNAIKYTQAGSHICVIWRVKGDAIQLEVTDNGPGIPAENLDRLFERFYRVDKSRSRNMGGTGLGLAIVKHIVKAHGGDVSVQSTQGKGTRFLCLFPVRAVPI